MISIPTMKPPRMLLIFALLCMVIPSMNNPRSSAQTDSPAQPPVNPFGIVEGFWFPEISCTLGVGWERIIFDWSQHQPESADDWYTLNVDDRWLKAADDCNREVVAVVKNTPAWATDGLPGVGVPRGLGLPLDSPDNTWANFMRRLVDYYASRGVTRFIIWNEPDISAETYGYEFAGDLEDYFQLLKVAYLVANETNPAAEIHLAGTTYWHDVNAGVRPYMERLIERIQQDPDAANHNYYFDILSLHIYFRTDSVYDIVAQMRAMLDANGMVNHRIWINETNAAPTDDPQWLVQRPQFQINLQHQADFLVQSAALGLAAGAERIAAYKLYDQNLPTGGESFGLLNPATAQPRPAFFAWQTVTTHFSDAQQVTRARTDALTAVRMRHARPQETLVMWAHSEAAAQVSIRATADKAYRIDTTGNIVVLRPVEGMYTLTLPSAHCEAAEGCFLGGSVTIFIQPVGNTSARDVTSGIQINFD